MALLALLPKLSSSAATSRSLREMQCFRLHSSGGGYQNVVARQSARRFGRRPCSTKSPADPPSTAGGTGSVATKKAKKVFLARCLKGFFVVTPTVGLATAGLWYWRIQHLHSSDDIEPESEISEMTLVPLAPRETFSWFRVAWRSLVIFCRTLPIVAAFPWCWLAWSRGGEQLWWEMVLHTLQAHGPLAIKFAQWASTRPDILPPRVCGHFSELQDAVRAHSWEQTRQILTSSFGPDWESKLEVKPEPVGSGCMAQVYHAKTKLPGSQDDGLEVAIKVRHPSASELVDLDLEVLSRIFHSVERVWSGAQYLGLTEALGHLEAFVRPQADMRVEAANMERFRENFEYNKNGRGLPVCFPKIIRPFVDEAVLVETFESAVPLQAVLNQEVSELAKGRKRHQLPENVTPDEVRQAVGKICMDTYMKMLFGDNFIHGDLHPGNIHFRYHKDEKTGVQKPELVVFDAGLAIHLSRRDRRNFVEVFHAIATKNGNRAGQLMVERTPGDASRIVDAEGFVRDVGSLIDTVINGGMSLGKVSLGDAFSRLINLACDHRVKLETGFVTVANSIVIVEGVGRQLNPLVDLLLQAKPLLADAMLGRV